MLKLNCDCWAFLSLCLPNLCEFNCSQDLSHTVSSSNNYDILHGDLLLVSSRTYKVYRWPQKYLFPTNLVNNIRQVRQNWLLQDFCSLSFSDIFAYLTHLRCKFDSLLRTTVQRCRVLLLSTHSTAVFFSNFTFYGRKFKSIVHTKTETVLGVSGSVNGPQLFTPNLNLRFETFLLCRFIGFCHVILGLDKYPHVREMWADQIHSRMLLEGVVPFRKLDHHGAKSFLRFLPICTWFIFVYIHSV